MYNVEIPQIQAEESEYKLENMSSLEGGGQEWMEVDETSPCKLSLQWYILGRGEFANERRK